MGSVSNEIKLEAGAHPVRLSSGDWLHSYAAATPGRVAHGNYSVWWISDQDPSLIKARSTEALMVPSFDYSMKPYARVTLTAATLASARMAFSCAALIH